MSFLSPLVLGGLAAVGVPILIHLLNKLRVRKTDWAAMRFLNDIVEKNQRRVKMDDLILLVLRCLIVALAVLAFARPVLKGLGVGESGPVAAAVLLDHSASMGQMSGSVTRFDLAKTEIQSWLDKQDPQSDLALYLAGSRTTPLVGKPVNNFALFRRSLDDSRVSGYGSDFTQSLRLAAKSLATVTGRPKEIRIYTDGQATAFLQRDELRLFAREHPDIAIRPIVVGGELAENLGIVALRQEGGVPSVGQPVRFFAGVLNSGTTAAKSVKLDFTTDDNSPAGSATIPVIAPGETQNVSVPVDFQSAGPHRVTAVLPADAFAEDNKRITAVEVTSRLDVVIVDAGSSEMTGGFFLSRALVPVPHDQAGRYYLAPQFAKVAELPAIVAQTGPDRPEIVILCDPAGLSAPVADALEAYVKSGGGLVVFPGASSDLGGESTPESFARMLPGTLGTPVEIAATDTPKAWQAGGFTHEITRFWNERANGNLGSVTFTRYCPLALRPGGNVIVSFGDGQPAVAETGYGRGMAVLFNSNIAREWTNLPLHPAFVPFIQRLIGYIHAKNEARLNLSPGEVFRKTVDDSLLGKDFTVRTPDAAAGRTAGQIAGDGSGAYLRYAATERPGAYQLAVGDQPLAVFAVQMDPAESDLRPVNPAVLNDLSDVPRTTDAGNDARIVVLKEYWTALIGCVVALFVAEAAMAHRMSYAR